MGQVATNADPMSKNMIPPPQQKAMIVITAANPADADGYAQEYN